MKFLLNLIIIFSFCIFLSAQSKLSKETVFDELSDKYGNINSISMNFKLEGDELTAGKFMAVRGEKYRIQIGNRIIVCNGNTLWNYSISDSNVVISDFEPSESEFSIETFFFKVLKNLKPKKLVKQSSSGSGSYYILDLVEEKSNLMQNVNKIRLQFDIDSYQISSVSVFTDNGVQKWELENLSLNKTVSQVVFEFEIPPGVEKIDLR